MIVLLDAAGILVVTAAVRYTWWLRGRTVVTWSQGTRSQRVIRGEVEPPRQVYEATYEHQERERRKHQR